jgi:hypothetical protein
MRRSLPKLTAVFALALLGTGLIGLGYPTRATVPPDPTRAGKSGEDQIRADAPLEQLHAFLKPQPGEARWEQLPWLTSFWKARQKAAAEGKPIFVWWGGAGPPAGHC